MKFRKKPVVIDAIQWDGTRTGVDAINAAFPQIRATLLRIQLHAEHVDAWSIKTLEGHLRVSPGDWIIKGVQGEFYPCKPDIFAATYEVAND